MPGVPEAMQDDILKRYPLRRVRIPVGGGQLSIVIPDDRAWLREGSWAPSVLRGREPPYWCRIWPAAVAIARQLARAHARLPDSSDLLGANVSEIGLVGIRVLDLGCGIGVPGIQAAALGAQVCSVDFEADAIRFAYWNARAQAEARCVAGGDATDLVLPTTQLIDWARGTVEGMFDLVLLSDVTYHESHHEPIRRQLRRALAVDGCVLHADPSRDLSTQFLAGLAENYRMVSWHRRTAFQEHDLVVRLTLIAKSSAHLERWRDRLAIPADAADSVAGAMSPSLSVRAATASVDAVVGPIGSGNPAPNLRARGPATA